MWWRIIGVRPLKDCQMKGEEYRLITEEEKTTTGKRERKYERVPNEVVATWVIMLMYTK